MSYELTTIVGHLAKDPEMRYTSGGRAVTSFSIAIGRSWVNKETGEKHEVAQWYNVTVWDKIAETCAQYLSKGSLVLVTGKPTAEGYTNREGKPAASLKLNNDVRVQFLSTKNSGSGEASAEADENPYASDNDTGDELEAKVKGALGKNVKDSADIPF